MVGDDRRDRRRNEPVERFPRLGDGADVAGGGRIRLELEEDDTVEVADLVERGVDLLGRETGPRADSEPRQLEHGVGLLPRREVAELVGTDDEQRVVEALAAEEIDRPRIRIEPHVFVGKSSARKLEPRLRRQPDVLMARRGGHKHDELRNREVLLRRPRQLDMADMRRVERAAEEAYPHSSVSSPTSTSSPSRAPAALRIASSCAGSGGRPVMRKPLSVRKTRNPRRAGCGR